MKRLFLFVFLIFSICSFSQTNKFILLSDINYSGKKSESRTDSLINAVNSHTDLNFILVAGNITSAGTTENLNEIYTRLQEFTVPVYVIPGPSDYMRSDNGGVIFNEIWQENRFSFSSNGTKIIGINTSVINGSATGHFFPEDLEWLDEQLNDVIENKIIFVMHHNLEKIDNYKAFLNLLPSDKNITLLSGEKRNDKSKTKLPVTSYSKFDFSKPEIKWQYSVVSQDSVSLQVSELTKDSVNTKRTEVAMQPISDKFTKDSTEFVLYSAESVWGRNISETMIAEPLISGSKIITVTYTGIVTCFDSTGTVLWDYDTFGNVTSKPAVINDILIVGTLQGDLITINMENGSQLQSIGFDESITSEIITFEYTGKKDLMTVADDAKKYATVFGTSSGKIYCYLVETLEEVWINSKARALVTTAPLINKNRIFYSAWDGRIYCIDSRDGVLIWKYRVTKNRQFSPAGCTPVTDNKFLYYTTPDGKILKLDLRMGSKIWLKKKYNANASLGISVDKKRLFVKSTNGRFHIISARNGNWVREIIPRFGEDFSKSSLFERDKIVTFAAQNGDLFRINNKFYYKKLMNIGPGESHSVQPFVDNSWIISNKDGKLIRFIIK
ncbi:MAG: PQQ-binding-like beta-propeller repeat protein [Rhodothermaceae bacterium]